MGEQQRRAGRGGQGVVEYALILALAVVVVIAIVAALGRQVENTTTNVADSVGNVM